MTHLARRLTTVFSTLALVLLTAVAHTQSKGVYAMLRGQLTWSKSTIQVAQWSQNSCQSTSTQIGGFTSCFQKSCSDGQKYYVCNSDSSGMYIDCLLTDVYAKTNCYRVTCRNSDSRRQGKNYQLVGSGCGNSGTTPPAPPTFVNPCTKTATSIGGYVGCQQFSCTDGQKYNVCRSDYTGTHSECTLVAVPNRNNCFRATCNGVTKAGATRMQNKQVGTGCNTYVN